MIKNLLSVFCIFVLSVTQSFGQTSTGTLKGKVVTSDGHAAAYVSIGFKEIKLGISTDENGEYTISKVKPGNYTLKVKAIGLEPQEKSITIIAAETTTADFTLSENSQKLQEVIVSTGRKKYKVDEPSKSLRLNQELKNIPQNIQIITNELIKDQQIFDMLEGITRNVSGVTREAHWDNYARINMRGSNIAAFRNGMNVTMPWGPLTEDMSMIDRIEFVKGPAGFMLASGEPSGFYNIVTKKPTGTTKGEANLSMGSFDTYRAAIDLDGKLTENGKLLYRLNVMGMLKGSHRQYDYNNRYTIAPVLTYKINDKTEVTAEYTYQFSQVPLIGAAYVFGKSGYASVSRNLSLLEPNTDPSKIKDHSAFLTLNHKIDDNWKFTAQLGFLTFGQIGSSTWANQVYDDGRIMRSINVWDAWGQNKMGQAFLNGKVTTGQVTHRILAGLDMGNKQYMADFSQAFKLDNPNGLFNINNPQYGKIHPDTIKSFDRSKSLRRRVGGGANYENYTGIYVQDEIGFLDDKIRLTLAGRFTALKVYDGYSRETNDSKFTPRIGLSVSLDKQTSVYGLFDQSFIAQPGLMWGGGTTKPLDGNNLEFGIKKDWMGDKWNTTIAAYQITKKNVNAADPDPTHTPANTFVVQVGETQAKGIEFDLRGEITEGLNLTLNYAYTDSKITKNGGDTNVGSSIDGYAKHLTNGWLSYRFNEPKIKGLGVSLGYQYMIDRKAGAWGGTNPLNQSLPDYFRLDGAINWQGKKTSIGLNVNNILDKYLYTGAPYSDYYYWQAEPGVNFRLSVGFKF
ncbi:TonB-dependent receptor [Pedobacter caeni]|uniref:Iron complex outermembrane recepter protein n=1 Tax=Pedobacter caeni TaxID=288992 RepID=A0A1M5ENC5_9SPHI|nr:TonB-dependent receptor [Pedobacter caeni]SHF80717.1 iron complex outermembrane recepter protein [Pedobacter caeni]